MTRYDDYYPRERSSNTLTILAALALIAAALVTAWLFRGQIVAAVMAPAAISVNGQAAPTAVVRREPVMPPQVIRQYQQAAPGNAVEDHALNPTLAITPQPYQPPVAQPASAPQVVPAGVTIDMLCPDGTYQAHCPSSEPTHLTAAQQQAVQETDSVLNSLNSAESTMTEAQKMVAAHDAEWNIKNMQAGK